MKKLISMNQVHNSSFLAKLTQNMRLDSMPNMKQVDLKNS